MKVSEASVNVFAHNLGAMLTYSMDLQKTANCAVKGDIVGPIESNKCEITELTSSSYSAVRGDGDRKA